VSSPPPAPIPGPRDADREANVVDEHDSPAVLDYGWWASNGPTGGYLTSLAIDVACGATGISSSWARSVDLHVIRLAAAGPYRTTVSVVAGPTRINLATVTFAQGEPFAISTVYFGPSRGASGAGDAKPPAVLPPEVYAEMTVGVRSPPVMQQFSYRPTTPADGQSAKDGWDLVWVRALGPTPPGRVGILRLVDCWYPPNHMRVVRKHLAGGAQLTEPPAVNLLAASVHLPGAEDAYTTDEPILVANRLDTITEGHYYERAEAWSLSGQPLLTATLLRRNEQTPPIVRP